MANQNSKILKVSNIIAFILTVIVNSLAGSTTIIAGKNTAEISDANLTLITPAGYTFAIWGIIYVLLGIFVIFQALPSNNKKDYTKKIGWFFVLSSILNIVWLFLWQYEVLSLSVIVMFMLLYSLISIYRRLDVGKTKVEFREQLFVHVPFSTYLGWITIASIANVATTLVSLNWDGFGILPETWAILIVIVALLITLLVLVTRKDVAFGLVVVWALVGIWMGQSEYQNIVTLIQASSIIVLLTLTFTILNDKFRK